MPQDLHSMSAAAPRRANPREEPRLDVSEFHRVLGAVPAGAYVCDHEGLIAYFNARAVEIWGREPLLRDVRDRYCGSFRLFTRDGAPLAHDQCWMARALLEDREFNGCEVMIERPDGQRVTALAHANPIHDEDGAVIGAVNILMDISDRKRGERAHDDLLASLGHELRNPLGPVSNAVHILRANPSPDAQSKWALDLIERQVEDLVCLIDFVSEVARLSRDSSPPEFAPFGVAALVAAAEERMRPVLARKGQVCALCLPSPDVTAFGDARRLQRAIESLIQSASRLQRSGETINVSVTVTALDWKVVAGPRDALETVPEASMPPDAPSFDGARPIAPWAGLIFAERLAELHGGTLSAPAQHDGHIAYELALPLRPPAAR